MGIGISMPILVQDLYFMTLWVWVLQLGDIMKLSIFGMGTIYGFEICTSILMSEEEHPFLEDLG